VSSSSEGNIRINTACYRRELLQNLVE